MDIITVNGFEKSYGDFKAVKGISFSVKEGSLFAFLGPNGAGKSTTIDTLCTLLACQKGDIRIAGYQLGKDDKKIRESIGVVFQQSLLDASLTVKDNLYLRGAFYGLSKSDLKARINEVAKFTGVDSILGKKYGQMSGGQVRRADIARALINRPKLLFLDEPMTGLDPKTREDIWNMLFQMKNEMGMTIFLTTHYMEETRDADHVVILDKGQVIAKGTPAELKSCFASSKFLWYTPKTEENDRTAATINPGFNYDADHYNILFTGDIIDVLMRERARFKDFEILKGSMDDVFLNLTGRMMAN